MEFPGEVWRGLGIAGEDAVAGAFGVRLHYCIIESMTCSAEKNKNVDLQV